MGVRPYMAVFTSRGCPFKCVYCHQIFGKRFRARSAESVVEEIARLIDLGMKDIEILDDISNFDIERFHSILGLLLERGLHPVLSFPNAVRVDMLREESIKLLKQVGVGEVSVAVETSSPRLPRMIRKNLDLDRVSRNIELLAENRIFSRGFFMLGFPTETEAEMLDTIRYACRSRLHLALFFTVNPYRNTELYDMLRESGKLPDGVRPIDYEYYGAPFNGGEVSDHVFRMVYRYAYLRFYLNPRRMLWISRDRPYLADIPTRTFLLFRNLLSFRRLEEGDS